MANENSINKKGLSGLVEQINDTFIRKDSEIEADKLKTPVKIFGQDFDGTEDISDTIYAYSMLSPDSRDIIVTDTDNTDVLKIGSDYGKTYLESYKTYIKEIYANSINSNNGRNFIVAQEDSDLIEIGEEFSTTTIRSGVTNVNTLFVNETIELKQLNGQNFYTFANMSIDKGEHILVLNPDNLDTYFYGNIEVKDTFTAGQIITHNIRIWDEILSIANSNDEILATINGKDNNVHIYGDLTVDGNIEASNINEIESKLEGVTKAVDDSNIYKGISIDDDYGLLYVETTPSNVKAQWLNIAFVDGLKISHVQYDEDDINSGKIQNVGITIDTNIVATKEDVNKFQPISLDFIDNLFDSKEWELWLIDCGDAKLQVIKKIKELAGIELSDAKNLAESAPVLIKSFDTYGEALKAKVQFDEIEDCITEIK